MATDPNNVKHPDSTFETEYPYNQATITRGGHEIHINDAPGMESLRIAHTQGSYVEIDRTGRFVQAVVGKTYNYHTDGVSTTVDGHNDTKVGGTQRTNVDGSATQEIKGNQYQGAGGIMISGSGDSELQHVSGDKFTTINGNITTEHTGNTSHSIVGDYVLSVKGQHYKMLNGEYGIHSQKGNIDIKLDAGRFRLFDQGPILIESTTLMTLKVGTSMIIIDPTGVTIKAPTVKFIRG